jgi:hypothetical protein
VCTHLHVRCFLSFFHARDVFIREKYYLYSTESSGGVRNWLCARLSVGGGNGNSVWNMSWSSNSYSCTVYQPTLLFPLTFRNHAHPSSNRFFLAAQHLNLKPSHLPQPSPTSFLTHQQTSSHCLNSVAVLADFGPSCLSSQLPWTAVPPYCGMRVDVISPCPRIEG